MARAFSVRRSNAARAVPLPSHWDKETIVSRRERHPPQLREIQSTFEPSRLSLSWLAQAYEQVVPIVRRTTSEPWRRPREEAAELQRHPSQGLLPCVGGCQQRR
jgi:hypothetical protein